MLLVIGTVVLLGTLTILIAIEEEPCPISNPRSGNDI